jgi:NADH:ubiquinone oxidoreductase subunit 6 (subunit J)
MDLTTFLFWLIACLTGISAVAVVVTQNIVRSATWLLFALAGTAGVFFLLGADFVGATQLLVYVGGTLVLVVFGVMLTAQGPFISMRTSAAEWAVSAAVGLLLYAALALSILSPGALTVTEADDSRMSDPAASASTVTLGEALFGFNEATPPGNLTGANLPPGKALSRTQVSYLLPFEIVSVHLLVVLIGAAYLARAKRRRGAMS